MWRETTEDRRARAPGLSLPARSTVRKPKLHVPAVHAKRPFIKNKSFLLWGLAISWTGHKPIPVPQGIFFACPRNVPWLGMWYSFLNMANAGLKLPALPTTLKWSMPHAVLYCTSRCVTQFLCWLDFNMKSLDCDNVWHSVGLGLSMFQLSTSYEHIQQLTLFWQHCSSVNPHHQIYHHEHHYSYKEAILFFSWYHF